METTYFEYAQATARYLENEWPNAAAAVASCVSANQAAVRATLDCFMRGDAAPKAAGDVASAVAEFMRVE